MGVTSIEWTDRSVNPIRARNKKTGAVGHYCVKIAPECANCYASGWQPRFKMPPFQEQVKLIRNGDIEIFLDQSRLQEVLRRREPTKWFWCDMTDMFGDWVPEEFIDQCFAVMANTPHHTHQVLTKRPERMREYIVKSKRVLPNVWLIVSAGSQETADEFIPILLDTPAAVRGLSAEPLLGPMHIGLYLSRTNMPGLSMMPGFRDPLPGLDWVIAGGESGRHSRPVHPDWIRSLRDQCQITRTPFFFKQYGEWAPSTTRPAGPSAIPWNLCKVITPGMPDHYSAVSADGETATTLVNVGKKAAGRLLDGREWSEFPK